MKFIVDVMLGRLAKRLRLLGFDVFYDRNIDDNEIIRLSLEQHRLILTRDRPLAQRPLAANHLFIVSEDVDRQLEQVIRSFSLDAFPHPLTRCSLCNTPLSPLPKNEARDLVPSFVYDRNETFLQCRTCERVYWSGTHVRKMGLRRKKRIISR